MSQDRVGKAVAPQEEAIGESLHAHVKADSPRESATAICGRDRPRSPFTDEP